MDKNKGAATQLQNVTASPKLSELGIDKKLSTSSQKIAAIEYTNFRRKDPDSKENKNLKKRCEDEVLRELPPGLFYIPEE